MSADLNSDIDITPYIAQSIADEEIPIIDVGSYLNGDLGARGQLAVDLRAIQESLGFFVIVNHGVSQDLIDNSFLKKIKIHENIIIEDLSDSIDENLLFTIINTIDQDNKYLIATSVKPIVELKFKLDDLNSRSKNFLLSQIEQPEDDLMYALILKNLSDRQISINKKLIDFIIKRISRSYGKISDFIYKIDEISLKRKKPIDFKIIKEALGE